MQLDFEELGISVKSLVRKRPAELAQYISGFDAPTLPAVPCESQTASLA